MNLNRFCFEVIVLIETLWNVKWRLHISRPVRRYVLIETLWNVKMAEIQEKRMMQTY